MKIKEYILQLIRYFYPGFKTFQEYDLLIAKYRTTLHKADQIIYDLEKKSSEKDATIIKLTSEIVKLQDILNKEQGEDNKFIKPSSILELENSEKILQPVILKFIFDILKQIEFDIINKEINRKTLTNEKDMIYLSGGIHIIKELTNSLKVGYNKKHTKEPLRVNPLNPAESL